MNRLLLQLLACVLLGASFLYGQIDTVTILHINDTHSCLAPIGPRDASLKGSRGGIARAATLVGIERMADPMALLLHAGDFSIGDLFYNRYFGAAELRILGAMGCDAMTLGNHEFDLTPSALMTALDSGFVTGSFPVLSANTRLGDPAVAPLRKYVMNSTTKKAGKVKVGIFGLTTPATNVLSQPAPAVVDTDFITTAMAMVDSLRRDSCAVIVCLSHLGDGYDQFLAQHVPGIHLIVGGHDHLELQKAQPAQNPAGDTTWIVQANAFYLDLGKVRLAVSGGKVKLLDYTLLPITDAIPEEPAIAAAVDGMISDIEAAWGIHFYTEKIADVVTNFKEVADSLIYGKYETSIGDLVTDAFRTTTHTQIAMEVGGSTAQTLYRGPIVPADVFRVVGYGFNTTNHLGYRLVTFTMKGADLAAGLEFGLSAIEQDDEFVVQASGMKYSFDPSRPAFSRVTRVLVGGKPLKRKGTYTVTANEFVPLFLSTIGIKYDNLRLVGDTTTEFSSLLDYVKKMAKL